jgi:hypothetical protein
MWKIFTMSHHGLLTTSPVIFYFFYFTHQWTCPFIIKVHDSLGKFIRIVPPGKFAVDQVGKINGKFFFQVWLRANPGYSFQQFPIIPVIANYEVKKVPSQVFFDVADVVVA